MMDSPARLVGVTFFLTGLVIIGISIPLIFRRIPMNHFYGVRLPRAFESDANWYAINTYGGRILVAAGGAICLLGIGTWLISPSSSTTITALSVAPVVIMLLTLWPVMRFARRLPPGRAQGKPVR